MTSQELESLIEEIDWFQNLGTPIAITGAVQIPNLAPWADSPIASDVADNMDWLPSSHHEVDPIHNGLLRKRAGEMSKEAEIRKRNLKIYKKTQLSLRRFGDHSLLRAGPHHFKGAACGAALFAARHASFEILVDEVGFWCTAMNIYASGHWPCGILPDTTLVIL